MSAVELDRPQRFDIVYTTRFRYPEPVRESHNEVRACPVDDEHQSVLHYGFRSAPASSVQSFRDYWGTRVEAFGVREPHAELVVVAESEVEVRPRLAAAPVGRPLSELRVALRDAHFDETIPTEATGWSAEMLDVAREIAGAGEDDPTSVVRSIEAAVRDRLDYVGGETNVSTTAAEAWAGGAGVCQDFAHVAVALGRAVGLPSRYVSGFLFTSSEATGAVPADTDSVDVQTHAWVEFAVEPGRWVPIDPTNGLPVRQFHVKIGHGRHYDDVCPFHGSYVGEEGAELEAAVAMRRAGERELPRPSERPADRGVLAGRSMPVATGRAQQQQQQQQ
ncbi:MAG: transglutaminase family protein [Actinomycetota bacterium]